MTYKKARFLHFKKFHEDLKNTGYIIADFASYNDTEDGILYTSFVHRKQEAAYYYNTRYIN